MRKPILFICFIIAIVIGLSVMQVSVSNSLSTTGIELASIEEKITKYEKENARLSEALLTASSFDTIASKAAELGFIESKSAVVLTNPQIAAKP